MIPSSTSRRRRRDGTRRGEGAGGRDRDQQQECRRQQRRILASPRTQQRGRGRRSISFVAMAAAGFALAAGKGGVGAQWTDGGAVALMCDDPCYCSGSSDDGTLIVFDNPSTGDRIVSVDGAYYGILETTCASSVIEVGSTIYELSGVEDLETRGLEVLSMSPSPSCAVAEVPTTADCYSAPTETMVLSTHLTVNIDFSYATWTEGTTTQYKSNFYSTVTGAEELTYTFEGFCGSNGFMSQVFSIDVLDNTYKYNFEFEIPGDPTSSDLAVEEPPSSQAGAFICGELVPTPAPSTAEPESTASPVAADPPVVADTATPGPVAAEPPVGATTTAAPAAPPAGGTAAPLGAATTTAPSSPPVNGTADTVAPTPAGGGVPGSETAAPSAAGAGAGAFGGVNASQAPTPVDLSTVAPSVAGTQGTVTPAPSYMTEEYVEDNACVLPVGDPCTIGTPVSNINQGVGEYYDLACNSSALAEGEELPEGCTGTALCRLCYFDTPLYQEMNEDESLLEYPDCPCCILEIYNDVETINLDGPRCGSVSPAPVAGVGTRGFDTMGFEDAGWEMNAGEVAALTALGLLAALTFFPFCSK